MELRRYQVVQAWLKRSKNRRISKKKLAEDVGGPFLRAALRRRGACRKAAKKIEETASLRSCARKQAKARLHGAIHRAIQQHKGKRTSIRTCYRRCDGIREKTIEIEHRNRKNAKLPVERTLVFTPEFSIKEGKVRTKHLGALLFVAGKRVA
jgi:hypothetical protein